MYWRGGECIAPARYQCLLSTRFQPYALVVGGGNGSCRLTGLWQTVRGASNPMAVDNCYRNWWSEKFTTTGRRRWFPAWSWTKDCTAHDQATLEPKVKVPYWHRMSELCFKQARPRKWKLETGQQDITVTKQRRWKLLGHVSRKVNIWTSDSFLEVLIRSLFLGRHSNTVSW